MNQRLTRIPSKAIAALTSITCMVLLLGTPLLNAADAGKNGNGSSHQ